MKTTCVLFFAAVFAAAQALDETQVSKLKEFAEKCTKESGVNPDLVVKARKGEFSNDAKLSHYYFCMFLSIGIVNENGEVQLAVVRQKMPSDVTKEEADKVIEACKNEKGANKYETSRKLYECYYKNSDKHFSFA